MLSAEPQKSLETDGSLPRGTAYLPSLSEVLVPSYVAMRLHLLRSKQWPGASQYFSDAATTSGCWWESAGANVSFLIPCGLNTGLLVSKGEIHKTFQGLGEMKVSGGSSKVCSRKQDR